MSSLMKFKAEIFGDHPPAELFVEVSVCHIGYVIHCYPFGTGVLSVFRDHLLGRPAVNEAGLVF